MEQVLSGVLAKVLAFNRDQLPGLDLGFTEKAILREKVPFEQYCADRTRINASALKHMLKTEAHFLSKWNEGLIEDEEEPQHFKLGRAAHMALLEPQLFRELYVIEPEFVGFTQQGKPTKNPNAKDIIEQRSAWLQAQKPDALILNDKEMECLVGMIESVLSNQVASAMLRNGIAECVLQWTDRDTGVRCKARPDFLSIQPNGDIHLVDFKTAASLDEGVFIKQVDRLKYHFSMAFYADACLEVFNRLPTTISLFGVEKTAPYGSVVFTMDDPWYLTGKKLYKKALKRYRTALESGKWPAYTNRALLLQMPQYMQDIDEDDNF